MSENEIRKLRIEKKKEFEELGIETYGRRFLKTNISDIKEGNYVKTAGRIMAIRKHGNASFADLVDWTGKIQLYFKKDIIGEENYNIFK
ncbi:MAG: OB-fold nucleic acid binding domain-containing protein, partial [Candidatus Omnitrophica bacterium]|nr:OB-fold nucleic acid binding domain-containing protein [Candidatus Omnitrophota bacterium]